MSIHAREYLMAAAAAVAVLGCHVPPARVSPMSQVETRFLDVPGGRIAYDDSGGPGPLVVAIPGMGDLRGEYRHLSPHLIAAGYRVVSLDVRGHGESSASWDDYSAHAVARDALALIDHLDAGPAVVLGSSFAAGSAEWARRDAPEKVVATVHFGPIVRDMPTAWYTRAMLAAGFGGPWRVPFWMTFWDSLFPTARPADQQDYRRALAANLREPGRMDALRAMIKLSKADTDAMLGTLPGPSLIVMGTKDPDFAAPEAEAHLIASRVGGRVLMVAGAGHYPQAEMPDVVGPRVVAFLREPR